MTALETVVEETAKPWDNSPYYANAEKLIHVFWRYDSEFQRLFEMLDLTSTLELACGHGRHSEIVQPLAGKLILMDVFQDNLTACRTRLAKCDNVEYVFGNGYSFEPVRNEELTSIFCYDAMVHFDPRLMEKYLMDTARVLRPGGMALYHHSNYDAPVDQHYGRNPNARNKMTRPMFNGFAKAAGLEIVEAFEIDWGKNPKLDGVSLLRRPQ